MKTLEEFTQAGGILHGGKHSTHEEYEGAPRPYNEKLLTSVEKLGLGAGAAGVGSGMGRNTDSGVGGMGSSGYNSVGPHSSHTGSKIGAGMGAGAVGAGAMGHVGHHRRGSASSSSSDEEKRRTRGTRGSGMTGGSGLTGNGSQHTQDTSSHKKPGLLDRLNPLKDSDHDGKKGFNE